VRDLSGRFDNGILNLLEYYGDPNNLMAQYMEEVEEQEYVEKEEKKRLKE
jgi:hypothetical protein